MLCIIPDVLDWATLKEIRRLAAKAEFRDGRLTAGYRAKRVKNNAQMDKASAEKETVAKVLTEALKANRTFRRHAFAKRVMAPIISRYEAGMNYGAHVDDALMNRPNTIRTDLATTIFISDPNEYEGGELVIDSPFGEQQVKLPAGAAVLYPATTLHHVAPVIEGVRTVAVTWIQSHIRDAGQREILTDLDQICEVLARIAPDRRETDLAFKTYANLTRRWAEV